MRRGPHHWACVWPLSLLDPVFGERCTCAAIYRTACEHRALVIEWFRKAERYTLLTEHGVRGLGVWE